jgi:exodeoxyribonuclease V gamma subunit
MPIRFRLHLSSGLDRFLADKPELFYPDGIFGTPLALVVQNQNVAEWLKVRLAGLQGIAVDRGILLPESAIRELAGQFEGAVPDGKRVLFLDSLKIAVYKELKTLLAGDDPDFDPLRAYLKSDPDSRMYDLSDTAAGLFYQYSMNSFSLLDAWKSSGGGIRFPEAGEAWQKKLWQSLFGGDSPWLLAGQVMERIVEGRLPWRGGDRRVVLFGSSFLGEAALRFFHHLSRFLPVDHFFFSPGDDPLWGGPGKSVERLLGSLEGVQVDGADRKPSAAGGALAELQRRLAGGGEKSLLTGDSTFRVFACPGDLRQVETARDVILGALKDDPSLLLTDIGIMAPDINRFSPLIGSVIKPVLPCNFIDLSGPECTPYSDIPRLLFGLAGSRFSRSDLFPLMTNPCFRERHPFDENDFAAWTRALDKLAVYEGFEDKPWSWVSGFGRQAEYLLGGEENPPLEVFDEQKGLALVRLTALVHRLGSELAEIGTGELTLEEWVSVTLKFVEAWAACRPGNRDDENDYRSLQRGFRNIFNAAEEVTVPGRPKQTYPFGFWRRLLLETAGKSGGNRGRYLTDGITCSSLKPLRAVPFRMILVLGLDEDVFPSRRSPESFDLSVKYPAVIDFTRETGDLYGFLETVTACGGSLNLFYNGSDPRRDTRQFPSEVVTRLLGFFEGETPVKIPLQPFDPVLFGRDHPVRSWSVKHFREALRFAGQPASGPAAPVTAGTIPPETRPGLTLKDLTRFLNDPVAEFFSRRFGLYLRDDNEEDTFLGSGQEPMIGSRKQVPRLVERWALSPGFEASLVDEELNRLERQGNLQPGYRKLLRDDLAVVAEQSCAKLEAGGPLEGPHFQNSEEWGRIGPWYTDGSGHPFLIAFAEKKIIPTRKKTELLLQAMLLRHTGALGAGETVTLRFVTKLTEKNYKLKTKGPVNVGLTDIRVVPGTGPGSDGAILETLRVIHSRGMSEPLPLIPPLFEKLKIEPGKPGADYLREAEALWPEMLEDDSDNKPLRWYPAVRLYRSWIGGFKGLERELEFLAGLYGRLNNDD